MRKSWSGPDWSISERVCDIKMITRMMEFTMDGLMEEHFRNGSFQPEMYFDEVRGYLDEMKKICYT